MRVAGSAFASHRKNKIDIYDIPIVEITEQYMEYIRQMQEENLNIMSEFMVMKCLLDIKKCFFQEVTEEGEEKDPREGLECEMLEYKMFKYMSYEEIVWQMLPALCISGGKDAKKKYWIISHRWISGN